MKYSRKHILNKNLKALEPEDGIKLYVVYVQVIFKRKNYMFKSMVKSYYTDLDFVSQEDRAIMEYELELLDAILTFEFEEKGEKFDLPGFSDKYNYYRRSVVEEGERLLISMLERIFRSKYKKYQNIFDYNYIHGKFVILMEAAEVLMPDVKKDREFLQCQLARELWMEYMKLFPESNRGGLVRPTVFDWISNGHHAVMKHIFDYKKIENIDLLIEYLNTFDFNIKAVTINR